MKLLASLKLLTSHLVVALVALLVIGGATRVMEAGLACPDWPLCYGVLLPGRQMNGQVFLEWLHRLDAFVVGLALLALLVASVWSRRQLPRWLPGMALLAVSLVALQGGLGALTVTHLLASPMVTAHLATALLLVWLISAMDQCLDEPSPTHPLPRWWIVVPVLPTLLVLAQCVLGGAMASQWAVDHCLSAGNQCGWLFRHRQLAGPAALSVLAMAGITLIVPGADRRMRAFACTAASLVGLQILLGVLTLHWQLQRPVLTMGHQFIAALLVAVLGAIAGRVVRVGFQTAVVPSFEVSCG